MNILFNGIDLVAAGVNVWPSNQISYLRYERGKNGLHSDVPMIEWADYSGMQLVFFFYFFFFNLLSPSADG